MEKAFGSARSGANACTILREKHLHAQALTYICGVTQAAAHDTLGQSARAQSDYSIFGMPLTLTEAAFSLEIYLLRNYHLVLGNSLIRKIAVLLVFRFGPSFIGN